jgi:hypothetical protein
MPPLCQIRKPFFFMGVGCNSFKLCQIFLPFFLPFCHAFLSAFLPSFVRLPKVPEGKDGGRPSFITAPFHFELNK